MQLVCSQKKIKANYFYLYHSVIKPQINDTIFGSNLRNNCKCGYDYVCHLTCVMPIPRKTFQTSYILATKKNSQTV